MKEIVMGSGPHCRPKTVLLTSLLAAVVAMAGCQGTDEEPSVASKLCGDGYNAQTGVVGELTLEASAKAKVTAFLQTSHKISVAAKEIETDALNACKKMGKDLGMSDGELTVPAAMRANDAGADVKFACAAVAAKIKALIAENVPKDASLTVQYSPARCEVNVDFQRECVKTCEQREVTTTEIQCKPGKLSGMCAGSCSGSCSAQCMGSCEGGCTGECNGTCEGTCTAECSGTCEGICEGTCDVVGADGRCMGKCTGKCSGKCSAGCKGKCEGTCKGSCSATCTGSCSGSCTGSCTGSCSVAFQAPKCEEVEKTQIVTQCNQTCDTQARASAMCAAPELLVDFELGLQRDPMRRAKVEMLVKALRANLPVFLKATLRAKQTLQASLDDYVKLLGTVALEVKTNVKAAGCLGVAVGQSGNDVQRVGGAAQANGDMLAALRAKGQAAIAAIACDGFDAAKGTKPTFTGPAGVKLNALLDTSISLAKAAEEMEKDAVGACRAMAADLGLAIPAADTEAASVCGKVKAEIDRIIASLNPQVKLRIVATPAVCTINAMASFTCVQTCEMKTITETDLQCKPGKLSGTCSASCTGSCSGRCSASVKAACTATCKGKCSGKISAKCTGTCNGACEGTCSAMGADGQCAGTCSGTCTGSCTGEIEGSCEGMCEGSCSAEIQGQCMGTCMGGCTGGCSVMYTAPYCEEVEVMREVTECQRSCDAKAKAEAMCTAPSVTVVLETNLADEKAKAEKLIKALSNKNGLPQLFKVAKRARGVVEGTLDAYVSGLDKLPAAIKEAGAQAAGCIAAAATVSAKASVTLKGTLKGAVDVTVAAAARAN
jgi:hypothetical protein